MHKAIKTIIQVVIIGVIVVAYLPAMYILLKPNYEWCQDEKATSSFNALYYNTLYNYYYHYRYDLFYDYYNYYDDTRDYYELVRLPRCPLRPLNFHYSDLDFL